MKRERLTDRELDSLMREYIDREGAELLELEETWHDKVPESVDKAAERAFQTMEACVLAGLPLPLSQEARAPRVSAGKAAVTGLKVLSVAVAGAAVLGAGAYIASPAVRGAVTEAVSKTPTVAAADYTTGKGPGEYVIPDPGEGFAVTEEAAGERLRYRWFTSADRELLVEAAYRLPEDAIPAENVEYVTVGGLWGTYAEAEDTRLLILRDGDVLVLVEYWGAEREELFAYAEKLINAQEETK